MCPKSFGAFTGRFSVRNTWRAPGEARLIPSSGYLKEEKVGAFNWGFVSGKTQTIYPWDSWEKAYTAEPPIWFHDIFRKDGTPFDSKEVAYIKSVTKGPGRAWRALNVTDGVPGLTLPFHRALTGQCA